MKSLLKIVFHLVVISAIVAGGIFYYFQYKENTLLIASLKKQIQDQKSVSTDLFDLTKTTKDEFTYLVSAPKVNGDWKMIVNDSFIVPFSFTYKFSPWSQMRYAVSDLTATDGPVPAHGFKGLVSYAFCAGNYYCNEEKREGMGFNLTFWDAKYINREKEPNFYIENGEKLLKETDKYIVTYKPFSSSFSPDPNIDKEITKLMSSFEIY